jgi:hypothetical protein
MTAALIAQLVAQLGPIAFDFILKLAQIWEKPTLTPDEVAQLCAPAAKSYADYIAQAKSLKSVSPSAQPSAPNP